MNKEKLIDIASAYEETTKINRESLLRIGAAFTDFKQFVGEFVTDLHVGIDGRCHDLVDKNYPEEEMGNAIDAVNGVVKLLAWQKLLNEGHVYEFLTIDRQIDLTKKCDTRYYDKDDVLGNALPAITAESIVCTLEGMKMSPDEFMKSAVSEVFHSFTTKRSVAYGFVLSSSNPKSMSVKINDGQFWSVKNGEFRADGAMACAVRALDSVFHVLDTGNFPVNGSPLLRQLLKLNGPGRFITEYFSGVSHPNGLVHFEISRLDLLAKFNDLLENPVPAAVEAEG